MARGERGIIVSRAHSARIDSSAVGRSRISRPNPIAVLRRKCIAHIGLRDIPRPGIRSCLRHGLKLTHLPLLVGDARRPIGRLVSTRLALRSPLARWRVARLWAWGSRPSRGAFAALAQGHCTGQKQDQEGRNESRRTQPFRVPCPSHNPLPAQSHKSRINGRINQASDRAPSCRRRMPKLS